MKKVLTLVLTLASGAGVAIDLGGMSAGIGIGTAGPEISLSMQPSFMADSLNMRFLLSSFTSKISKPESKVVTVDSGAKSKTNFQSNAQLELSYLSALADWHPFDNGFRLTGGLAYNNSKMIVVNNGDIEVKLGSLNQIRSAKLESTLKVGEAIVPYFGFGYGHNMKADTGFKFDVGFGVYLLGKSKIDVKITGLTPADEKKLDIDKAKADAEEELALPIWPHINLGLTYKFK